MLVSEIGMKGGNRTDLDRWCCAQTLKILELLPIDRECRECSGDVASVVAVVDPGRDVGSPVDNTKPAAVGILPVGVDLGLESGVVLVLFVQGVLPASQGRLVFFWRAQGGLQVLNFSGKSDDVAEPCGDGVLDLGDGMSGTAITTNEDVLRVDPVELVISGSVNGGDVFVGEGEDPLAGVAAARLHLLKDVGLL